MSSAASEKYTSSYSLLKNIVKTEGMPALFKGAGASILYYGYLTEPHKIPRNACGFSQGFYKG